jgi:hypothetical protein
MEMRSSRNIVKWRLKPQLYNQSPPARTNLIRWRSVRGCLKNLLSLYPPCFLKCGLLAKVHLSTGRGTRPSDLNYTSPHFRKQGGWRRSTRIRDSRFYPLIINPPCFLRGLGGILWGLRASLYLENTPHTPQEGKLRNVIFSGRGQELGTDEDYDERNL